MSDDALITGAAAPVGNRRIRSTAQLDAGWVVVSSTALIISSFFALVDLPTTRLQTGDDPLRFFVLGLPIIAIVIAVVGATRRSEVVVAVATGVVTPGFALAGSLGASLLLSEASAFADVGVAISIAASLIGIVTLVRWFVYHPIPLLGVQTRPVPRSGQILAALGVMLAVILVVTTAVGDTSWSAASVGQTLLMLTVAVVVSAAGVTRTIAAAWLACAACSAQLVSVLVVKAEQSTVPLDSDLALRTGVAGLAALAVTAVMSVFAAVRVDVDAEPDGSDDDPAPWRWSSDE